MRSLSHEIDDRENILHTAYFSEPTQWGFSGAIIIK